MSDNSEIAIIYKPAGTNLSDDANPTPLHVHAAELGHFGIDRIYGSCSTRRVRNVSTNEQPTQVNVFAVPNDVWQELQQRVGGAFGFRHWHGSPYPDLGLDDSLIVRQLDRIDIEDTPVLIRDLIGRRYRAYKTNDGLDRTRDPDRINIESDAEGKILGIWIG